MNSPNEEKKRVGVAVLCSPDEVSGETNLDFSESSFQIQELALLFLNKGMIFKKSETPEKPLNKLCPNRQRSFSERGFFRPTAAPFRNSESLKMELGFIDPI